MTVSEFQVESPSARGSDDYLDDFAACLDRLFESGWELAGADGGQHGFIGNQVRRLFGNAHHLD
jgi:hypothetical protein